MSRVSITGSAEQRRGLTFDTSFWWCARVVQLVHLGGPRRVYTGDRLDSLVGLHFRNRTSPHAEVKFTSRRRPLRWVSLSPRRDSGHPQRGDAVSAFLLHIAVDRASLGWHVAVSTSTITVPLFDDGSHDDGAMEPDGIYNNRLKDLTRAEGTYEFRGRPRFGEGCTATREAFWSVHVEPGIDPGASDVTLTDVIDRPDGRHGVLIICPRDVYRSARTRSSPRVHRRSHPPRNDYEQGQGPSKRVLQRGCPVGSFRGRRAGRGRAAARSGSGAGHSNCASSWQARLHGSGREAARLSGPGRLRREVRPDQEREPRGRFEDKKCEEEDKKCREKDGDKDKRDDKKDDREGGKDSKCR